MSRASRSPGSKRTCGYTKGIRDTTLFSVVATSIANYRPDHPLVKQAKGHGGTLRYPSGQLLHIVMDNYGPHLTEEVRLWAVAETYRGPISRR